MERLDLDYHRQGPPRDVTFSRFGESVLCSRAFESGLVRVYEVTGQTRNPRVLVRADRAVVDGSFVGVSYQESLRCVRTGHPMAGLLHRFPVDEVMEQPALLLEELPGAGSSVEVPSDA